MVPLIGEAKYRTWCKSRGLDLDLAHFHLDTCYFGRGLRTRPGALVVFEDKLTHYSYRWFDTFWAIFEPSVRVDVPWQAIRSIKRERVSLLERVYFLGIDTSFTLSLESGEKQLLFLQRDVDHFHQTGFPAGPGILTFPASRRAKQGTDPLGVG